MRLSLDLDERLKSVEEVDLSELLDAANDAVKNANCGVAFQICEIIVKRLSLTNEPIVRKKGGKITIYRAKDGLSGGIKRIVPSPSAPVAAQDKPNYGYKSTVQQTEQLPIAKDIATAQYRFERTSNQGEINSVRGRVPGTNLYRDATKHEYVNERGDLESRHTLSPKVAEMAERVNDSVEFAMDASVGTGMITFGKILSKRISNGMNNYIKQTVLEKQEEQQ